MQNLQTLIYSARLGVYVSKIRKISRFFVYNLDEICARIIDFLNWWEVVGMFLFALLYNLLYNYFMIRIMMRVKSSVQHNSLFCKKITEAVNVHSVRPVSIVHKAEPIFQFVSSGKLKEFD